MRSARYVGRLPNSGTDLDDSAHGPGILTAVEAADIAYIDDPMSFPWELITTPPRTPLVIDAADCSADQLSGLRPALSHLNGSDTILNAPKLAQQLGVRSTTPAPESIIDLARAKSLDVIESSIIARLGSEWHALVVDYDDIVSSNVRAQTWNDTPNALGAAVVVRVPGAVIRTNPQGMAALASELISQVDGSQLVDVWGVRAAPGDVVDRGLVVIRLDR